MKTQLYRKVEIKSEEDLPDSDKSFIVHTKQHYNGESGLRIGVLHPDDYNWYQELNGDSIYDVDWYLLPVELPTDEEIETESILQGSNVLGAQIISQVYFRKGAHYVKSKLQTPEKLK
jgi:hypothetical protein